MSTPKKRKSREDCDRVCNLRVAVRIRPKNQLEQDEEVILKAEDKKVQVLWNGLTTTFGYDRVFPEGATQTEVFETLGLPLLESLFSGFNACLFAYGQTGSGKSYSMTGPDIDSPEHSGIIPRLCQELFTQTLHKEVQVSYFEIYNEKIRDLLNPATVALKVREHPTRGPYVVDLTKHTATTYHETRDFLKIGGKARSVNSTALNDSSSRSHAIFTIELQAGGRISLIDLAGSERPSSGSELRLKEGAHINKSLLTLGKCITALADSSAQFIPYRESSLTWLLKESLGGNSLTTMLATVAPSGRHVEETLSTLRYACQARSIVNRAKVDKHHAVKQLRVEVERLRALRNEYQVTLGDNSIRKRLVDIETKLVETERDLAEAERARLELECEVRVLRTPLKVDSSTCLPLSPYRSDFLEQLESLIKDDDQENEEVVNKSVLSKSEIVALMNRIYGALKELQPQDDHSLSLLYAKVNKTLMKFESALLNSVAKSDKTVTFDLEQ